MVLSGGLRPATPEFSIKLHEKVEYTICDLLTKKGRFTKKGFFVHMKVGDTPWILPDVWGSNMIEVLGAQWTEIVKATLVSRSGQISRVVEKTLNIRKRGNLLF